ncbi:MAG TPA: hypothetical protein VF204_19775 [Streptosporangiaceae bacterium]
MPDHTILATVTVTCDDDAAQIDLTETLLQGHAPFHQVSHVFPETDRAGLYIQVGCQPGTYSHSAVAHITSETGYLPQSMVLQITDPDVTVSASACNQPAPGGPGGGGGGPVGSCATATPSVSARPAVIRPQAVTC